MRNPLNKRLKRDLVKNKGRYIAIALLFIVVISVISAFLVVLEGVEDVYYDNQIECKVEDGLFSSYFEVPKDVLDDIEKKGAKVYENYYIEDSFLKNDTLRYFFISLILSYSNISC